MKGLVWLSDLPWWLQAVVWAVLGGGILYHVATGHAGWYWWVLATVPWLAFVDVVLRRKPSPPS
jgi:hypothetical protein